MRDVLRLLVTVTIWGAFIAVVGIAFTSPTGPIAQANGGELIAMLAIMALVAASMTRSVWRENDAAAEFRATRVSAKRKRSESERLARLLEQLDDEKIHDLEILLAAQRGEVRDADDL